MARSGFKLKSGNISGGASFKAMGATPGESPAQLGGLLRWVWKGIRHGRKSKNLMKGGGKTVDDVYTKTTGKVKQKYGKTDVQNVVDDAIVKSKSGYGAGSPKTQIVKDIVTAGIIDAATGGNVTRAIKNVLIPEVEVKDEYTGDDPNLKQKFKKRKVDTLSAEDL